MVFFEASPLPRDDRPNASRFNSAAVRSNHTSTRVLFEKVDHAVEDLAIRQRLAAR